MVTVSGTAAISATATSSFWWILIHEHAALRSIMIVWLQRFRSRLTPPMSQTSCPSKHSILWKISPFNFIPVTLYGGNVPLLPTRAQDQILSRFVRTPNDCRLMGVGSHLPEMKIFGFVLLMMVRKDVYLKMVKRTLVMLFHLRAAALQSP